MTTFLIVLAVYMFIGYGALWSSVRSLHINCGIDFKKAKELDPMKAGFFESLPAKVFGLLLWPLTWIFYSISIFIMSSKPEVRYGIRKKIVEAYGTTEVLRPDSEADSFGKYM